MNTYQSQVSELGIVLGREFPNVGVLYLSDAIQKILRLAQRHQNLATEYCNRQLSEREEKEYEVSIPEKLSEVSREHFDGNLGFAFSGDPRGITVKLVLPSGLTNDWGKTGWCVPVK